MIWPFPLSTCLLRNSSASLIQLAVYWKARSKTFHFASLLLCSLIPAELYLEAAVDPNNHMDDFLGWVSGHSSRISVLIHFAVLVCLQLFVGLCVLMKWNAFGIILPLVLAMVAAPVLNTWWYLLVISWKHLYYYVTWAFPSAIHYPQKERSRSHNSRPGCSHTFSLQRKARGVDLETAEFMIPKEKWMEIPGCFLL